MENATEMKKDQTPRIELTCPRCGRTYSDHPALSRRDNQTLICPTCGIREALESIGTLSNEDIEKTISVILNAKNSVAAN